MHTIIATQIVLRDIIKIHAQGAKALFFLMMAWLILEREKAV
jgi:hypothetical protein